MIAALIDFSARNRLLVLLATLMTIGIGIWSLVNTPLDALPDLSDTQVIVYTEYPGQAPQVVEDQVTYPLATALLAVPHARVVRGFSNFGVSFVYVVFEDGTDLYWARSRVLEYLNFAAKRLPDGVTPTLGPDFRVRSGARETTTLTFPLCTQSRHRCHTHTTSEQPL
jgi:copper/silver efflux system protein